MDNYNIQLEVVVVVDDSIIKEVVQQLPKDKILRLDMISSKFF